MLFHCKTGCTKLPQCYFIPTLSVFLISSRKDYYIFKFIFTVSCFYLHLVFLSFFTSESAQEHACLETSYLCAILFSKYSYFQERRICKVCTVPAFQICFVSYTLVQLAAWLLQFFVSFVKSCNARSLITAVLCFPNTCTEETWLLQVFSLTVQVLPLWNGQYNSLVNLSAYFPYIFLGFSFIFQYMFWITWCSFSYCNQNTKVQWHSRI